MGSLPAPIQRAFMILLPPLAVAICCFVLLPRQKRLRQIEGDIKTATAMQRQYLDKLEAIRGLPKDPRIATLPATREEQSNFLRGLSNLCTQSGNKIISVTALAAAPPPPAPPPGTAPAAPVANALPSDVVEIKSTITFEGNFTGLRDFLGGLQRSRRLISMSDCRIGAAQAGFPVVQTSLSIVRYVDKPADAAAATQAAPANANQPQKTASIGEANRG